MMKKYRSDFWISYLITVFFSGMLAAGPSMFIIVLVQFMLQKASEQERKYVMVIFQFLLPVLLVLIAVWGMIKMAKILSPYPKRVFDSQIRLYEPPQELAPLILARYVYHADFAELGGMNFTHDELDFSQVMQATVLDLIDRGNLKLEKEDEQKFLSVKDYDGLADFELEFLSLLFDKEVRLPLSAIYKAFQINEDDFKDVSPLTVDDIKYYRRGLLGRYVSQKLRIRDLVEKELKQLNLSPLYHDETSQCAYERLTVLKLFPYFSSGSLWVMPLLALSELHVWLWVYPIFAILLTYFYTKLDLASDNRRAILKPEGQEVKYLWTSFRRMLAEIGNFKERSTDDIVLWNRYIVYAVFFGIVQIADTELGTFELPLRYQEDEVIFENLSQGTPRM